MMNPQQDKNKVSTPHKANSAQQSAVKTKYETEEEKESLNNLRPICFTDFPGQDKVKDKLKMFVQASIKREESLDHCLLSGPPGLGKTTLAHIIANTLKVELKSTSGPAIRRKGDIAAILTTIKPGTVLFIDEIHRLSLDVEEYLYSAMEDFYIDIVTGEGFGARSIQFQLPPFTLIGATTRVGLLKAPFRNRFGIIERLSLYDEKALKIIISRSAGLLNITTTKEGAQEIARRSRGTPRVANRLLKRVRDFVQVHGTGYIDQSQAVKALEYLGVDKQGLDFMDLKILTSIKNSFQGGPVGVDTLAAILGEETDTIEDFHEPFLIQQGFIQKTARGRVLTKSAQLHLEQKNLKQV